MGAAVARELVCGVGVLCQLQKLACAVNVPQPAATVDCRGGALQPSAHCGAYHPCVCDVPLPAASTCRRCHREAHCSCVYVCVRGLGRALLLSRHLCALTCDLLHQRGVHHRTR